ncbi:MAG: DUF3822 family protein [Crocinitomicaceae bacterium]|nr:DUF3822 family protein [Crocinitomicaceae bacterium]
MINSSNAHQHQLSIELSDAQIRFAILKGKELVKSFSENINEKSRSEVERVIKNNADLDFDFGDVTLSYSEQKSTLVPVQMITDSQPEKLFKFCYGDVKENIDYNRIPELGLANIFQIPLWVKSAFVINFPVINIYHSNTIFLKGIFNETVFKPKAHVLIYEDYFHLILVSKTHLLLSNSFIYKSSEDVIYHLLFALDQKEISKNDVEVHLYGEHITEDLISKLKRELKNTQDHSTKHKHFILQSQSLCV